MHVYIECLGDILLKLAGSRYLLVKVNCTMRPLLAGDGAGLVDEEALLFKPWSHRGPIGLDSLGPHPSISPRLIASRLEGHDFLYYIIYIYSIQQNIANITITVYYGYYGRVFFFIDQKGRLISFQEEESLYTVLQGVWRCAT